MQYQASCSTSGKIRRLLVAYDGSKKSRAFVKDVLKVFPEDTEVMIWTRNASYANELSQYAQKIGRKSFCILPEPPNNDAGLVDPQNQIAGYPETIWLRDPFCACRIADKVGLLASGFFSIPETLLKKEIIGSHFFHDQLPAFGDILYDRDHLFVGHEDIQYFGDLEQGISPEQQLRKLLFPGEQTHPKIVQLGYRFPLFASVRRENPESIITYFSHTDLFLTPTGIDKNTRPVVMVAKAVAFQSEIAHLAQQANALMSRIVRQLENAGITVIRNPVPILRLKKKSKLWVGYYNNALVEVTADTQRTWLPHFKFKNGFKEHLDQVAAQNKAIWEQLGFEVAFISGGMRKLSNGGDRAGALRCLTIDFRN